MAVTPYPDVDDLLGDLRGRMRDALGERLRALYLYGSLVAGDFDHDISDIDMLAVVRARLDDEDLEALRAMHDGFADDHPAWDDRIDVTYAPAPLLQTFRTQAGTIAVISPGEPFHTTEAGREWLMNWWMVREQGRTLFGPSPETIIGPITRAEFLDNVRFHTGWWLDWLREYRGLPAQSYVVITACRAMYAIEHAEQTSKGRATAWAAARYPQWAGLIRDALEWRRGMGWDGVDPEAAFPNTLRFVRFATERILARPPG